MNNLINSKTLEFNEYLIILSIQCKIPKDIKYNKKYNFRLKYFSNFYKCIFCQSTFFF